MPYERPPATPHHPPNRGSREKSALKWLVLLGCAGALVLAASVSATPLGGSQDTQTVAGTAAFPSVAGRANIGSLVLMDMVLKVDPANHVVSLERAAPGLENGCPNA